MKRPLGRPARSSAAGYTLLELMIVLAILAVLAAVSWPLLRRPLNKSYLQDGAQQLTKVLTGVRLQAMAEGRAYVFRYQLGAATYHWCPAELLWADTQQSGSAAMPRDAQPAAASSAGNYLAQTEDQQLAGDPLRDSDSLSSSDSQGDGDSLEDGDALREGDPLGNLESLPTGARFSDPQLDADPALLGTGLDGANGLIQSVPVNPPEEMDDALPAGELDSALWSEPVLFYPDGRGTNAKLLLVGDNGYQVDVSIRGLTGTVRIGPLRCAEMLPWEEETQSPQQPQEPAPEPRSAASPAQPSP